MAAAQRARGGPLCPYSKWRPKPCLRSPAPNQDGGSGRHPGLLPALKMAPPHRLPPPTEWRRASATRSAPYPARGQSSSGGESGRQPREAGGPSPPRQDDSSADQWNAGAGEAGRAAPPFCESITRSGLARPAIAAPPLRSRRVVSVCNGRVSPARRRAGAASGAAGPLLWCGSSRVEDPRRGWSDTCRGPTGAGGGGLMWGSPPPFPDLSPPRGRWGKCGRAQLAASCGLAPRALRTAGPGRRELGGPGRGELRGSRLGGLTGTFRGQAGGDGPGAPWGRVGGPGAAPRGRSGRGGRTWRGGGR